MLLHQKQSMKKEVGMSFHNGKQEEATLKKKVFFKKSSHVEIALSLKLQFKKYLCSCLTSRGITTKCLQTLMAVFTLHNKNTHIFPNF